MRPFSFLGDQGNHKGLLGTERASQRIVSYPPCCRTADKILFVGQ